MEEGQTPGRTTRAFHINLETELAFNASENKTKTNLPSHLCFNVRTSYTLHSPRWLYQDHP